MVAMVIEDFRTRTARTSIAHGPEIVRRRNADDAIIGKTGNLLPEIKRFVIFRINSDEKALFGETKITGDQVPGVFDRLFLEIIAKGEIPQHFKESMVSGGIADIVEVIVLSASAHAFLRCRRARRKRLFGARENVLERHHARIHEQEGRIVIRHQWRRRFHRVTTTFKEGQKTRTNIRNTGHADSSTSCRLSVPFLTQTYQSPDIFMCGVKLTPAHELVCFVFGQGERVHFAAEVN